MLVWGRDEGVMGGSLLGHFAVCVEGLVGVVEIVFEVRVEFVVSLNSWYFGAREFDRAAVSVVRMAYKSLPRLCVGVKARDVSILLNDNLTPLWSILNLSI